MPPSAFWTPPNTACLSGPPSATWSSRWYTELMHLELESLPRNEASRREEEYVVNHMADALLRLEQQDGDRNVALADAANAKLTGTE